MQRIHRQTHRQGILFEVPEVIIIFYLFLHLQRDVNLIQGTKRSFEPRGVFEFSAGKKIFCLSKSSALRSDRR
jgi:hypothetical protein